MLLITGATGQLGTAVLHTLLQKMPATELAALVRDETKATALQARGVSIRVGHYADPASLDRAMQGIDRVLLISGGGEADSLQQHYNVVDAAKKAGIRCLAYTSRSLKDPATLDNQLMVRHFQTEDYIKASGMSYLLFRNALYMDVLPLYTGPHVVDAGIALPAEQGKVAYALRSDMGEAIANVLLANTCDNRTYYFTGAEAYSFDDVAAALTQISGKKVTYTPIAPATFTARMQERGMSAFVINLFLGFMTDIKHGQEATVRDDLATVLGRQPTSLAEGLKQLYQL